MQILLQADPEGGVKRSTFNFFFQNMVMLQNKLMGMTHVATW